jgi:hypothetical protein
LKTSKEKMNNQCKFATRPKSSGLTNKKLNNKVAKEFRNTLKGSKVFPREQSKKLNNQA